MITVKHGYSNLINFLISIGAKVNQQDKMLRTALMYVMKDSRYVNVKKWPIDYDSIINQLIKHGADETIIDYENNNYLDYINNFKWQELFEGNYFSKNEKILEEYPNYINRQNKFGNEHLE